MVFLIVFMASSMDEPGLTVSIAGCHFLFEKRPTEVGRCICPQMRICGVSIDNESDQAS